MMMLADVAFYVALLAPVVDLRKHLVEVGGHGVAAHHGFCRHGRAGSAGKEKAVVHRRAPGAPLP
jgi:hypothetical protein